MLYYYISEVFILTTPVCYVLVAESEFYLISLKNIFKEDITMTKGQLIAIASTAAVVATATTIAVIVINKKKAEAAAAAAEEATEEVAAEEVTEEVAAEATEEVAE